MRTMQKTTSSEEPEQTEVGLILHRVPYEDCQSAPFVQLPSYVYNMCSSGVGGGADEVDFNFSFGDFFQFFDRDDESASSKQSPNRRSPLVVSSTRMNISSSYLTLQRRRSEASPSAEIKHSDSILDFVQPMQIEAFRIGFNKNLKN